MSHTLTEIATFPATVTVPNPGDPVVAADVEVQAQVLADRTQYLVLGGLKGSFTRSIPFSPTFNAAYWDINVNGQLHTIAGNVGGGVTNAWVAFRPKHTATITAFGVVVTGAPAHGALPGTKFSIALEKTSMSTGIPTPVATATDGSGTTGAYQAAHLVSGSVSEVVDIVGTTGYSYRIVLVNESGANSIQAGLVVHAALIAWTDGKD